MMLTELEQNLYNRQMMIPGWGIEKQSIVKQSTVFIAGAGGLGSPVAIYLAVAGIGHLKICDYDIIDISNLNRQILHDHSKIGSKKVISAMQALKRINSNIRITPIMEKINEKNVCDLLDGVDIIIDCLDNLQTRHLLNDIALKMNIPLVYKNRLKINNQYNNFLK